ncbi:uncharacterized protein J4E88_009130 [Alternaria novae-zelandiae]|uniref:uncharacterized protein n=1 Tax=Alternaria metachromatica TaxID=283354 RepID=UPI0020C4A2D3|nr:uncharacterized protein J4E83_005102 [Alternaria metachromatica]XP_049214638.1 uncharacterized protein J4E79_001895 [Alternaria viburni]XP_049241096.1 uncharacterized protein J4E84_008493 [Alternaria hordeiaustralica]XP_049251590.1 uncharacterized protein J4E88_009130 [Alternaria novae-zelandiae]XP_051327882.1 uncharacterized protein J4E85_004028 [Alternaria conjuncta]KAI4688303.1 hypothetical protein J4E81_007899 [Alternaria sp. BMP 2799]KAI4622359.1 hypothetical protein J4E83_005102 [Alt
MFTKTILLFTSLLPTLITAADTKSSTVNPELNAALRMAATNFDRNALLPADEDWYFDFDSSKDYDSPTGAVINANAASFPALTGLGSSMALLKLAPCGMLPPHLHPRATNLVTAITGNTTTYMIGENGVKTRKVDMIPMRVTIFPQGSLHMMQNNDCEPALLLSALNSDDSGTLNILPSLWSVPQDVISAGFGDASFNPASIGEMIPEVGTGAIIGSAECKKKCNIQM